VAFVLLRRTLAVTLVHLGHHVLATILAAILVLLLVLARLLVLGMGIRRLGLRDRGSSGERRGDQRHHFNSPDSSNG
jgi:hypothetical protein